METSKRRRMSRAVRLRRHAVGRRLGVARAAGPTGAGGAGTRAGRGTARAARLPRRLGLGLPRGSRRRAADGRPRGLSSHSGRLLRQPAASPAGVAALIATVRPAAASGALTGSLGRPGLGAGGDGSTVLAWRSRMGSAERVRRFAGGVGHGATALGERRAGIRLRGSSPNLDDGQRRTHNGAGLSTRTTGPTTTTHGAQPRASRTSGGTSAAGGARGLEFWTAGPAPASTSWARRRGGPAQF